MKKAVAIPYIIALIIGIIVVAVLAYWFISSGGKGSKIGSEAECTARKAEYCASQTLDAKGKVRELCKNVNVDDMIYWCDYCVFIPNWNPSTGPSCAELKKS